MVIIRPFLCAFIMSGSAFFVVYSTHAQTQPLIEIVHTSCGGIGCDNTTTRLYADGRYTSETNGTDRSASGKLKKLKFCEENELEPEELRKVLSLAEQPAFQDADANYTHTVIDYPDWFTITYRRNGREKTMRVANFSRTPEADRSKVPQPVVELMKWAEPMYFSYYRSEVSHGAAGRECSDE